MQIRKTLKYRLYRHKRNWHHIRDIEFASEVWNHFVALTRRHYRLFGKYEGYRHPSAYTLMKHLTKLKRQRRHQHWRVVNAQVLKDVCNRIDRAYKVFFSHQRNGNRRARPPKFCSRKKYKSITYTTQYNGWRQPEGNKIYIAGHTYKFVLSRPIEGEIKTLTVKRDRTGDLWLYMSIVIQDYEPILARTGNAAGCDFGLKTFLTIADSAGHTHHVHAPQPLKTELRRLQKASRQLSSKVKGSNNRRKAVRRLQKVHRRVTDIRRDFHFKTARWLLENYDTLALETLNLKGMKKLWGRKVSDLGFYSFTQILNMMAERDGKQVVYVDRWYPSTKTCSACGCVREQVPLEVRRWRCRCGAVNDRDENAARNLLNKITTQEKVLALLEMTEDE